ncbi:Longitudinals lacking protein, isoforms A/B/D/L, partial [Armadillidium vulgare]
EHILNLDKVLFIKVMDISHNFRFRWNDHVPHLSQTEVLIRIVFSELRFEEVYCDTTLITEDGFIMKAHGAVLITTSRYFERVLADVTPDQHPIIVLKGINYEELSFLLDYIYQGVTQTSN